MTLPRWLTRARRDRRLRKQYPGIGATDIGDLRHMRGTLVWGKQVYVSYGCHLTVGEGGTLRLGDGVWLGRDVSLGGGGADDITIGERTSIQSRCFFVGDVTVGAGCIFSLNVYISSRKHFYDYRPHLLVRDQDALARTSAEPVDQASRRVEIGDDVFVGINAVINPGVTIGRGAVIGSSAVVTRDVEPYAIMAGVPARRIGSRLAFAPPGSISWEREEDIPYFYSGFELAVDQRERNATLGGHVARSSCAVWVSPDHDTLELRMRSIAGASTLDHQGREFALTEDWSYIRVPNERTGPVVFTSQGVVVSTVEGMSRSDGDAEPHRAEHSAHSARTRTHRPAQPGI